MTRVPALAPFAAALLLVGAAVGAPPVRNGFVLDPVEIDVREILPGGPLRDGIPALANPAAVSAAASSWDDDEIVIGVELGAEARAYPLSVLVWHELVNDRLAGVPILVSYCPLCATGIVFERRLDGGERVFGVSGLLYRSDLLLYDRETESLWSQISAQAVTGPSRGLRLTQVRSRMLPWKLWREEHPKTSVLTTETGHRRDYRRSPYGDYATSKRLLFPTRYDRRYHPKTPTLGLRIPGGEARAYPAVELVKAGGRVEERFAGRPVAVAYEPDSQYFQVEAPEGIEVIEGFWFAWSAFHPETSVFAAPQGRREP
jgi:hypothetical protein